MGFTLTDLGDSIPDLQITGWNWKPVVAIIQRSNLIPEGKIFHLTYQGSIVRIEQDEAVALATHFQDLLNRIPLDGRVLADGSIVTETFEQLHERGEPYSVSRTCIEQMANFCSACKGFRIY